MTPPLQSRSHHLRFLSILTLALLLLVLFFVPQKEGAAVGISRQVAAGTLTILTSDDTAFSFELEPPPLQQSSVTRAGSTYDHLTLTGYGSLRQPGQPDLPQTSFFVALPPGAEAVLEIQLAESEQMENIRVAPATLMAPVDEEAALNVMDYEPEFVEHQPVDADVYAQRELFPTSTPLTLGDVLWLRDQRVVQVWVHPVLVQPAQDRITVHTRVQAALRFIYPDGDVPTRSSRPESDTYENILRQSVVNYEEARNWRMHHPVEALVDPPSPCLGSNAYRLTLQEAGMYKLTYAELAAAGLSGSPTSSTIRMCNEDQELHVRVVDGGDGSFGTGDYVVFFGEAIKTQETTTNVYWFTYGGSNGLRMQTNNEAANTTVASDYPLTRHLEEDHVYRSDIPMTDANDHWYWETASYSPGPPVVVTSVTMPFDVSNKAGGAYDVHVEVEVYGQKRNDGLPVTHRFDVDLNGQTVGTGEFVGTNNTQYVFTGSISTSALQNGGNLLTIEPVNVNNNYFYFMVNWGTITFRRQFVAENNRLLFHQESAGDWKFQASGFTGTADVYNVTNPKQPVRMLNASGSGTVEFSQDLSQPATYAMAGTTGYLSSSSVTLDTPSNLRSAQTADYIIITDPLLDAGLQPLRQLRQQEGLIVRTAFVRDIFDEFGYGRYSTEAIRDFLAYAYANWDGGGANPAPTYVLLVGEGSYDHRNLNGNNEVGDNLVPVYLLSGIDSILGETAADNRYVAFGTNPLAQMQLGRLPVKNASELSTVVDKLLSYAAEPLNPLRHAEHFFVADNAHNPPRQNGVCAPEPAGDFFATVNSFVSAHLGGHGQIVHRLYYAPQLCYPDPDNTPLYDTWMSHYSGNTTDMQNRMALKFSAGKHFVIYTGHARTTQWGKDSERFLSTQSVPLLMNGTETSIMLPMTCLEGIYQFPEEQFQGLSETLLRSPVGGAVASYAPTGLQVQTAHDFLIAGFYDSLYDNGGETLGAAIMGAKLNLATQGSAGVQDLQDTFMLLGDPAMQVKIWQGTQQISLPVMQR